MRDLSISSVAVGVLVFMLPIFALDAGAGSIVGSFDWENAGELQGWSSDEYWVHLSNPGSGGADGDGYLNTRLDPSAALPPEGWFALAKTDASSLFAGTWRSGMWVEFDFWAEDVQPQYVQVRWAGDSGNEWRSNVFDSDESTMKTQTWTHLMSAQFESYRDWDYGGPGGEVQQQEFVDDLASIDWIGVYIWRNSSDAQENYGLDNFNLMVPEPEEWTMILASVIATVLSIQRRRRCRVTADGSTRLS